jgi:hypothetical protein
VAELILAAKLQKAGIYPVEQVLSTELFHATMKKRGIKLDRSCAIVASEDEKNLALPRAVLFSFVTDFIPYLQDSSQNNPAKQGQEIPLETLGEVFPVMLDNQELFTIRQGIGSFSAQERAKSITARIEKIADDDALSPEDLTIKIDPEDKNPSIILGDTVIATITSRDAKLHAVTQEVLAERALAKIKAAHCPLSSRTSTR